MSVLESVLEDLAAESAQLDSWVAVLDEASWGTVTTPEGWTIAHQIAHLHWTDVASTEAITDPEGFAKLLAEAAENPTGYIDQVTEDLALEPPGSLLLGWRAGRGDLDRALRSVPAGEKITWFGPPMSAASMATARIMETWAHGHDVAEALGLKVPQTDRAKHICHLGVRTRSFAYLMRGQEDPGVEIRVELTAPSGELWAWGPADAEQRVTGLGWDFALLATRRRHRDDVQVVAQGAAASQWLDIVQAFAGLPGNDPVRLSDR